MSIQLPIRPHSMRRALPDAMTLAVLCLGLLSCEQAVGQGTTVLPQGASRHPDATTCLILGRMGTVDKVTNRVLSFGIHGKEFQYVEGKFPEGMSFHDALTERDVRDLQADGAEVVIVSSDLMPDELQQAREYCRAETRKTPVQAGTDQIEITSVPSGSDIELDGKFIGSTPSSVKLALGEHTIKLSRNGYATWERKITTISGNVRISPDLQPLVLTHDSTGETPANLLSTASR
jgi:hypothetical protein